MANVILTFDSILNDNPLYVQQLSLFVILQSKNQVSVVCHAKEGPYSQICSTVYAHSLPRLVQMYGD